MALRSLVKISSVNNLSDARYAAGMGVELMGFDLEKSSASYVSPEAFSAITSWVSGVKFVGEIQLHNQETISELLADYQLDYLQIANPTASNMQHWPLPLIVKIDQPDMAYIAEILQEFTSKATWFLIEPNQPLNDELLNWCTKQSKDYPIILGANVDAANVSGIIDSGFKGIALTGGHEIKPGYGNFDQLADVLEALEMD